MGTQTRNKNCIPSHTAVRAFDRGERQRSNNEDAQSRALGVSVCGLTLCESLSGARARISFEETGMKRPRFADRLLTVQKRTLSAFRRTYACGREGHFHK